REINTMQRTAYCDGSHVEEFDFCLLATGGRAREIPDLPPSSSSVHYVRTLKDAQRLGEALVGLDSLLVLGGGYLGVEVASNAAGQCGGVTVLDVAPQLLSRAAPVGLADWLRQRCEQAGIR